MKQRWASIGDGHRIEKFLLVAHLVPYDRGASQARGMLGRCGGVWRGYVYTDVKQSERPFSYVTMDFATEAEARSWVETCARLEFS